MEGQIDTILTSVADWKWCLDLLKPGGYLVFFGGDRFYRAAKEIEYTGFEIRDTIMWLHYTTKPIVLARKPFKGTLVENVLKNGVGGLNIDACRIPITSKRDSEQYHFNNNGNMRTKKKENEKLGMFDGGWKIQKEERENPEGRFPANLVLSYNENDFLEVCGGFPDNKGNNPTKLGDRGFCFDKGKRSKEQMSPGYDDSGSAARYFYNARFESWETSPFPISLVSYMVRLTTPKGGKICGSCKDLCLRAAIEQENTNGNKYEFIGV